MQTEGDDKEAEDNGQKGKVKDDDNDRHMW